MNVAGPEKIVVFGVMSHFPVAGVVWQTMHYLIGLQRLGYDVYYVEAHGCAPTKLMEGHTDDGPLRASTYVADVMSRFGLGDRWAYDTRYEPRRLFGMTELQLKTLYEEAALLINLSSATLPLPEHSAKDRLVYLETDPVEVQIDLVSQKRETIDFLEHHFALFSYGENFGNPDCQVPSSARYKFLPTRQPVVMDFWESQNVSPGEMFTTIGNWCQPARPRWYRGNLYHWSKHFEFLKFVDLPSRTKQTFELALSGYKESDRQMLESKGWRVRHALDVSSGLDFEAYRDYIAGSRGEFTVAKDQNIRLRSGWFSDRAVTYLAAGRPVITQETGFSNILPTGEGLFAFSTTEEILEAVDAINADYPRHCRAALSIAREHLSHDVVLKRLLADIGMCRLQPRPTRNSQAPEPFFTPDLLLSPTSRWPTRLPEATVTAATSWPAPVASRVRKIETPQFSVIIVVFNGLVYTRMCLASLLLNVNSVEYEVIVVDNASTDGTAEYLREVANLNPHVHVIANTSNRGYAAANNQGLAAARGKILVLLNNDTIVPRGFGGIRKALHDPSVGLAGPVTNWTCNEAQIPTFYRTYGELCSFAKELREKHDRQLTDLGMLAFFCVAMRRDVYERIGPLDERFGIGMLEDNDYSMSVLRAGYRIVCCEGTYVHHFGQGTIGELCPTGEYDALLKGNRRMFEEKWGIQWTPSKKRITMDYESLRVRIRAVASNQLPAGAKVLVISKGDEELLRFEGREGWHFPQAADRSYPYIYPADSDDVIRQLEALRAEGASHLLLPSTGFWWLDHYSGFAAHLGTPTFADESCAIYSLTFAEQ